MIYVFLLGNMIPSISKHATQCTYVKPFANLDHLFVLPELFIHNVTYKRTKTRITKLTNTSILIYIPMMVIVCKFE